jgi:hypothetical protein
LVLQNISFHRSRSALDRIKTKWAAPAISKRSRLNENVSAVCLAET